MKPNYVSSFLRTLILLPVPILPLPVPIRPPMKKHMKPFALIYKIKFLPFRTFRIPLSRTSILIQCQKTKN